VAKLAVLAAGPVGYTDAGGSQLSIPTSSMFFEDGAIGFAAPAAMDATTKDGIGKWLIALANEGYITPDTTTPSVPALIVEAKDAGPAGNAILIDIANVRPKPTDTTKKVVDAAVTETDVWSMLTPATIKTVVGTSVGTGDQRGLVFVSSAGAPVQPKDGTYPMAGDPAVVDIKKADNSAGAFSLKTKAGGPDAALTKVIISGAADAANPGTFSMSAIWTKAAAALEAGDIEAAFDYEIAVDPPEGGSLAVPAAGTYPLSGGASTRSATKASVSLPAGA
jgi:hypothetical protein